MTPALAPEMSAAALIGAGCFAAAAYLGILLANAVYGHSPRKAPFALIAGSALIGVIVAAHTSSPLAIVLDAIVCGAISAALIRIRDIRS